MLQQMRDVRVQRVIWITAAVTFVGGFLLAETSGLLGRGAVTTNTAVASVNGHDVLYTTWTRATQQLQQEQSQQLGRALTLDEQRRIEDQAFEQLVGDILLEQEYKRRGITVSDAEIQQAALYAPPPVFARSPELQTEGRFDLAKWQRYLRSPQVRQSGQLALLEGYYRNEIPKEKLYSQVASAIYVTDARLWRIFRDLHDSAQVSFVALRPETVPDSAVTIGDADIDAYWAVHSKDFDRPGRATLSLVAIPRVVTAADSMATRARMAALRAEIAGGANFADVAKRESQDSASAVNGGQLPRGPVTGYVPEFAAAASRLRVGELSPPVQTQFGLHVLKLDGRSGDTLSLRHILLRFQQSDTSATRVDRRADSLAKLAASSDRPARFDSAARLLQLTPQHLTAIEGNAAVLNGRSVPSVSAWAFGGAKPGETSDLIEGEDGYYLARLDSITPGGIPPLASVRDDVRRLVAREKKLDKLAATGAQLAAAAASTSLERAAEERGLSVTKSAPFTRGAVVPGLGQLSEAIGVAFGLPVGATSKAIRGEQAVIVLRVDRRIEADRAAFEAQKKQQREALLPSLRERYVRDFIDNLRKSASVKDRRKELIAVTRRAES